MAPPAPSSRAAIIRVKAAALAPDVKARERIANLMSDALSAGMNSTTAALMTAKATGETVATVLSTWRACQ